MLSNCDDIRWMRRALELAAKGRGRVEPNPMVGAVIVRDGRIIGEGYHERFGGPHAEVRAMEAAGECRDATLYVTLEPCTGTKKKTRPCCDAVERAGFRRVVIGLADPTQERAVPRLEAAGMEVVVGILEAECRRLVAPFLKLRSAGMPWVIAKWAMTADGRIATVTGGSKWISSDASRARVHQWRDAVDAVLVGIGTVRKDDPLLTCRLPGGRNPRRVVLDSHAALPLDSRLVQTVAQASVWVACLQSADEERCRALEAAGCRLVRLPERQGRVDAEFLLRALAAEPVTNILIEGGSAVFGAFFEQHLVDEVRLFVAPKLFGGSTAPGPIGGAGVLSPEHAVQLDRAEWTLLDPDALLTADVRYV